MDATGPLVAAGGVPWRRSGGVLQVGVVHRPKYDDWSFPKGKLNPDELPLVAAVREVREETGLAPALGRRLPRTQYFAGEAPKTVDFWSMAADGAFVANDETDAMDWLSVDEARERLSYADDVALLTDLVSVPVCPVRVLLVRHARAGDRAAWSGPDDLRPLDARGRAEAQSLALALPAFAPQRVLSAGPVRCRQTVAPLAEGLGLRIEDAPEFGEEYYDRGTARARLRAMLAGEGTTVVASQGGAIPDLMSWLLADRPRTSGVAAARLPYRVPCRKGSVWALSAHEGGIAAADYYRSFPD